MSFQLNLNEYGMPKSNFEQQTSSLQRGPGILNGSQALASNENDMLINKKKVN